ncbi:hypothetical protein C0992_003712 [Termitomyces sp. T32_za158]|nr:hypothetical protein C0992_003712 [Termitomyces sp. T32_za158]
MVGGVDAAILEKQLLVVKKGEGLVRRIVGVVTLGVVLFEVRVLGCSANLAQDSFFIYDQYSAEVFRGNNHTMVESITLSFEGLLGVDIGSPGQGVRLCSKPSWAVVDGEIVFGENLGLTSLATAELFSHGSFKVGVPLLEGFDDGEEFLVIDVVVEFCVNHRLGVEGNGA